MAEVIIIGIVSISLLISQSIPMRIFSREEVLSKLIECDFWFSGFLLQVKVASSLLPRELLLASNWFLWIAISLEDVQMKLEYFYLLDAGICICSS